MCDRTCGLCPTYNGNPPNFKNEFLDENPPDTAGEALSPEDWLAEMKAFFVPKLSEANLRNVMKQATALATARGRWGGHLCRRGDGAAGPEDDDREP